MTTLIILAAGRGARMGRMRDVVHKGLLPLGQRAAISHIIENGPLTTERIIVVRGDRADEITAYLTLAHPDAPFTFVDVDITEPVHGPGVSLLAGLDAAPPGPVVIASCDTVWVDDAELWNGDTSWMGVAARPAGTPLERWCRVEAGSDDRVSRIFDKTTDSGTNDHVYIGLCRLRADDRAAFTHALQSRIGLGAGEARDVWGFYGLPDLRVRHVDWIDIGDDAAYTRAVRRVDGYDWAKPTELTYVLGSTGRVVKYWLDKTTAAQRRKRGLDLEALGDFVPRINGWTDHMLGYDYVHGIGLYDAIENAGYTVVSDLITWYKEFAGLGHLEFAGHEYAVAQDYARHFYELKTFMRIKQLRGDELRDRALDVCARIDFNELTAGVQPAVFHGDLAFGNIIRTPGRGDRRFVAIDWRESFGGQDGWGDARYDVAKMLVSCEVHWGRARHGDFTPWVYGPRCGEILRDGLSPGRDVEIIAALSMLNSAPLHAAPLDEVLVARGCAWLERVL